METQPKPNFPLTRRDFLAGFGAFFVTPQMKDAELKALMEKSRNWAATPLASLGDAWKPVHQRVVDIPKTPVASSEPKGMVKVPAAKFEFRMVGTEIEGFNWEGLDV